MRTPPSASEKKPKALFLSPEAPYPAVGGGALRTASLLEFLAGRYSVHLILFHQIGDPDPAAAIPPGSVERLNIIELPRHSKKPAARAARNIARMIRTRPPLVDRFSGYGRQLSALLADEKYEIAVIEHFWCAPYIEQLRQSARRVFLDLHNVESIWHRSLAQSESGFRKWALHRFAAAAEAMERLWLVQFDAILATSAVDAELTRALAPDANICVYPNALPQTPQPQPQIQHGLVFSGNLEYPPNISAVRFFHDRIWPRLKSRWPELRWNIVGKNPEVIRPIVAGDPRIVVTGPVDDAIPALAQSQVAVIPLLAGSGTRVKILEAWAAGVPVVSTRLGAQGLDCIGDIHLLLAEDPDAFADAVSRLLASPDERLRIGAAGRRLFEERYTWPVAWKSLDPVLRNTTVGMAV